MRKRQTLNRIFGGQVWNPGGAIFSDRWGHVLLPRQLNGSKCPASRFQVYNSQTYNLCMKVYINHVGEAVNVLFRLIFRQRQSGINQI